MVNLSSHSLLIAAVSVALARPDTRTVASTPTQQGPLPTAIDARIDPPYTSVDAPPAPVLLATAPPPNRVDSATPAPAPGMTWVPGFWLWSAGRYVWVRGGWSHPPRVGAVWVAPQWRSSSAGVYRRDGFWRSEGTVFLVPAPVVPIAVDTITEGTLETGDLPWIEGERAVADEYALEVRAGRTLELIGWSIPDESGRGGGTLSLSVRHDGQLVATDEPGAGSGEREIMLTPAQSGRYVLRVATTDASSPVSYRLHVRGIE